MLFSKSKLTMPELSDSFLLNDRLRHLHTKMKSGKAAAISAPAGYGKTTLAISFFRHMEKNARVCWYRLEADDSNPSVFAVHLLETVFPSGKTEFEHKRERINDYTDVQASPIRTIAMLSQEMWEDDDNSSNKQTFIVFDDFQNVSDNDEIAGFIRLLLNDLPSCCSIIILSRKKIDVFTEKQKIDYNIIFIDTGDLSFSSKETEDILHHFHQKALDQRLLSEIAKRAEGWIIGILLLYRAITNNSLDALDHKKLGEKELFRYIAEEIFKSINDDSRDALTKLAILTDFSEFEAKAIFGIENVQELFSQNIELAMLFQTIHIEPAVTSEKSSKGTTGAVSFHAHSLLRDFLLFHLRKRFSSEEILGFQLKAAKYYIDCGAYDRATKHLVECEQSDEALNIVTKAGINMTLFGEVRQFKQWIKSFSDELISNNPILLTFKAITLYGERLEESEKLLLQALSILDANPDPELQIRITLTLAVLYLDRIKNTAAVKNAVNRISHELSGDYAYLKDKMKLLDVLEALADGSYAAAAVLCNNIRAEMLDEDYRVLLYNYTAISHYCQGELDRAERYMNTVLTLESVERVPFVQSISYGLAAFILLLKNEKERIIPLCTEILDLGEKSTDYYAAVRGYYILAYERYLSHDAGSAVEKLDIALDYLGCIGDKATAAWLRLLKRLWSKRPGEKHDTDKALEDLTIIRAAKPGLLVYETSLSICGAICRDSKKWEQAEHLLLEAIHESEKTGAKQALCGALFHLSKLYFAKGDDNSGRETLCHAMGIAAKHSYFMFLDIAMETLTEMALYAYRFGCHADFTVQLLERFYDKNTIKLLTSKVKTINESRIPAYVGSFLDDYKPNEQTDLHYSIKASLFGTPEISVNGKLIPDIEWKIKKARGIFEYLLFRTGKTIKREVLAEIFWPESNKESSSVSMRTTLYQLRKILTKYGIETAGPNALINETVEGLQINRNKKFEIDLHDFIQLNNLWRAQENTDKQAEILENMASLYRGDLLEDREYGEIAAFVREKCKGMFVDVCLHLYTIYLHNGAHDKAEDILNRALAVEPYDEQICLELIRLLIRRGMRNKAISLYAKFKKRFEAEIGVQVDGELATALNGVKS
jgi:DNA-binding SARP family transcriptional activator